MREIGIASLCLVTPAIRAKANDSITGIIAVDVYQVIWNFNSVSLYTTSPWRCLFHIPLNKSVNTVKEHLRLELVICGKSFSSAIFETYSILYSISLHMRITLWILSPAFFHPSSLAHSLLAFHLIPTHMGEQLCSMLIPQSPLSCTE